MYCVRRCLGGPSVISERRSQQGGSVSRQAVQETSSILPLINDYAEQTPGSETETKGNPPAQRGSRQPPAAPPGSQAAEVIVGKVSTDSSGRPRRTATTANAAALRA